MDGIKITQSCPAKKSRARELRHLRMCNENAVFILFISRLLQRNTKVVVAHFQSLKNDLLL